MEWQQEGSEGANSSAEGGGEEEEKGGGGGGGGGGESCILGRSWFHTHPAFP